MKKEYLFVLALGLIGLAYGIDYISGMVTMGIKSPYEFLNTAVLTKYPLTAVGVFSRSLGLMLSVWLVASLVPRMYFVKAAVKFVLAGLCELYAIQQMATGMRTTSVQWTLSLAFAGLLLVLPIVVSLIKGSILLVVDDAGEVDTSEAESKSEGVLDTE